VSVGVSVIAYSVCLVGVNVTVWPVRAVDHTVTICVEALDPIRTDGTIRVSVSLPSGPV
jgi:hypothetical protein